MTLAGVIRNLGRVTEIVEGLDGAGRDRIGALRAAGAFCWIDLARRETSADDLGEVLGIPHDSREALLSFKDDGSSSHRFYADGRHVAFALTCFLETTQLADGTPYRLSPVQVHVLVSGDYVLTLHEESVSLPRLLAPYLSQGGSDQYVVYAILDAMVDSAFDALSEVDQTLDRLAETSADLRNGRQWMAALRNSNARLSRIRRRLEPQRGLFERIGTEISRIEGLSSDDERYFERLEGQVDRLFDKIDASAQATATLIDLRLNQTTYWLTVVATIFLPLTFITGFFGMNFGWMVGKIGTPLAFWLLGVGSMLVGVGLVWRLAVRRSPVQAEPIDPERSPGRR